MRGQLRIHSPAAGLFVVALLAVASARSGHEFYRAVSQGRVFDLVLDATHFTDCRAQRQGDEIPAKIPDTVNYSLIVNDRNLVIDAAGLIVNRIATLGTPSIGAARLSASLPNPTRQPRAKDGALRALSK